MAEPSTPQRSNPYHPGFSRHDHDPDPDMCVIYGPSQVEPGLGIVLDLMRNKKFGDATYDSDTGTNLS